MAAPGPDARDVVRRLSQGQPLDDLGLGLVDGRLERLDLRDARLASWRLHDCEVVDSRFDHADCSDWRLWSSAVRECGFSGAQLEGSAVGTWHEERGNTWQRVDFTDAGLRVGAAAGATFDECTFAGADLTGVHFEQCTFVRCVFVGELGPVVFDCRDIPDRPPARLDEVDFSGAHFNEVDLYGSDLRGLLLPADPDLRVVPHFPCVVERALSFIAGDGSPAARVVRADLEVRHRMMRIGSHDTDANVVNRGDYAKFGDDVWALASDVLARAEAACSDARS